MVKQQRQTLKAVTHDKLLVVDILCKDLSLIEIKIFIENELTKPLTCHLAQMWNKVCSSNRIKINSNLEIFHFS